MRDLLTVAVSPPGGPRLLPRPVVTAEMSGESRPEVLRWGGSCGRGPLVSRPTLTTPGGHTPLSSSCGGCWGPFLALSPTGGRCRFLWELSACPRFTAPGPIWSWMSLRGVRFGRLGSCLRVSLTLSQACPPRPSQKGGVGCAGTVRGALGPQGHGAGPGVHTVRPRSPPPCVCVLSVSFAPVLRWRVGWGAGCLRSSGCWWHWDLNPGS